MTLIQIDLILTILASATLLSAGAVAICLLPRTPAEAAQLHRALSRAASRLPAVLRGAR